MTERIVDLLEVVEVEAQHGDLFATAAGSREGHLQPVRQQCPVGQPGKLVVGGQVRDAVKRFTHQSQRNHPATRSAVRGRG